MISHNARFAALHMTDHMPFYPTLPREGLNFHNTLFGIVLSQNTHAGFNGSLTHFNRLCFRHDHQPDFMGMAAAFTRSFCDLVKSVLIIFANRGNEVGHGIIIISATNRWMSRKKRILRAYCNEIKVPKRPVRPFSARCENQSSV